MNGYPSVRQAFEYAIYQSVDSCKRFFERDRIDSLAEATGNVVLLPAKIWLGSTRPGDSEEQSLEAIEGISDKALCRRVGYTVFASAGIVVASPGAMLLTELTNR